MDSSSTGLTSNCWGRLRLQVRVRVRVRVRLQVRVQVRVRVRVQLRVRVWVQRVRCVCRGVRHLWGIWQCQEVGVALF